MIGVWLSILLAIGFIGVYAWQITEEARQLADALAATELVLAREQHLSQLDGLAAAAAHELGTPLSTIAVIAKELENAIAQNAPHGEDVRLLREQATRCRDILAKLTELSASGEPFDREPLSALIEEVVAPHRNFGVEIDVALASERQSEPTGARNPAILYGLGNLLENAVDFARERVEVRRAVERGRGRSHHQRRRPGLRAGNSWTASASLTSAAAAALRKMPKTSRPDWGLASSSPRRCWSARAPRSRSKIAQSPSAAPLCACAGGARISSGH